MLKVSSKRRRTLAQIKADKEAAAQREADIEAKLAMVEQLQQQVVALQRENQTDKAAQDLLGQFIRDGAVEQTGGNEFVISVNGTPTKFRSTVGQ